MGVRWDELQWPVTTERLLLRPGTLDDIPATWHYRRLPEVARWITAEPRDIAEHAAIFGAPERLAATLIVELAESGSVIGDLKFAIGNGWAQHEMRDAARGVQAELGWAFDPAAGGRGYATEAVRAALAIAFDSLRLRRVYAECFAANEPSWRLMERIGMRRETYSLADGLHRSGAWMDGMVYAMLATEWREGR